MDIRAASLALHYRLQGKLEMVSRCPIQTQEDLSLAYTPGVAAPAWRFKRTLPSPSSSPAGGTWWR